MWIENRMASQVCSLSRPDCAVYTGTPCPSNDTVCIGDLALALTTIPGADGGCASVAPSARVYCLEEALQKAQTFGLTWAYLFSTPPTGASCASLAGTFRSACLETFVTDIMRMTRRGRCVTGKARWLALLSSLAKRLRG